MTFRMGGVNVEMIVDSGSPANIITKDTYEHLKLQNAELINEKTADCGPNYTGYASNEPIQFTSIFEVEVATPYDKEGVWTHVLVSPTGQSNLLSKSTAFALGVLQIGYNINAINEECMEVVASEFPKVPGVKVKIHVDPKIRPVCQPIRRLPISMEAEVERLIQRLLSQRIIEIVKSPSGWVSPLVPIRKSNGDIRLCVDLRCANKAVLSENFPMPNIEDAMATIRGASIFKTLDLESAYYHLELEEASRDITTYICRSGLYRFTRLVLGIKSAPVAFQKMMMTALGKLNGVIVFLDDILIFANSVEEHDRILAEVLAILKRLNLKINQAKSQFRKESVKFLRFQLSKHGVQLTDEKLKAFMNMRPPKSVTELRSFLGTLNFFGRFITNLSCATQNLRTLLQKVKPFEWSLKHENEFNEVKKLLQRANTLKYFDFEMKRT